MNNDYSGYSRGEDQWNSNNSNQYSPFTLGRSSQRRYNRGSVGATNAPQNNQLYSSDDGDEGYDIQNEIREDSIYDNQDYANQQEYVNHQDYANNQRYVNNNHLENENYNQLDPMQSSSSEYSKSGSEIDAYGQNYSDEEDLYVPQKRMGTSPSAQRTRTHSMSRDNSYNPSISRGNSYNIHNDNNPIPTTTNARSIPRGNTGTPSHTKVYTQNSKSLPLISTEIINDSRQRLLILIFFLILQFYKLYDLIVLKSGANVSSSLFNSRFGFILKYFIFDSLFIYLLPILRVPKLYFNKSIVMIQILTMLLLNIFISDAHSFVFISTLAATWKKFHTKELSLTGDSVVHQRVIDYSHHFKGALTVKILPENTALFNPFENSFCLPSNNILPNIPKTARIPIRINSTTSIKSVQLRRKDLFDNKISLLNFTKNQLKEIKDYRKILNPNGTVIDKNLFHHQTTNEDIHYLELPLDKSGIYSVVQIIDTNDFGLRILPSHLLLTSCPVATIKSESASINSHKCINDKDDFILEIQGLAPMKLAYTKIIGNQNFSFLDSNLQPESFSSPLQSSKKTYFSNKDLADLQWTHDVRINIQLQSNIAQNGNHEYKIDKLIDALGNEMDFSTLTSKQLQNNYLSYPFTAHGIPKATLDEKFNTKSPTKRSLIIKFKEIGDPEDDEAIIKDKSSLPYKARVSFTNEDGETRDIDITSEIEEYEFVAKEPGTYKLESCDSKFCPGQVYGKNTIVVSRPVPPQLNVESSPILDQCVGPVGLNFDLTFTGVQPFYYVAKIYKIDDKTNKKKLFETKKFTSKGSRMQYSYTPVVEGKYEVIFDQLSNDLFTDPIKLEPVENYSFNTVMRVRPGATLVSRKDANLCLGDESTIDVEFQGEAPFTLSYDIVETSSNKRNSYKIDDIKLHQYTIRTPKFNIGGSYIVSLVSIKDANNCTVSLSEPDTKISVRRDIPSAEFNFGNNANEVQIKEGSFSQIPLKLSGEATFTVKYEHTDFEGNRIKLYEAKFNPRAKPILKVKNEGIYRLVEMRDNQCNGKIEGLDKNSFKVSFLAKPSFALLDKSKVSFISDNIFSNAKVCQNVDGVIDLALTGHGPFTVNYEITSPNGKTSKKNVRSSTKSASIILPNNEAGDYTIKVKNIYDSNYNKKDHLPVFENETIVFTQSVMANPHLLFADQGKTFRTCALGGYNDDPSLDDISLKFLAGSAPYTATFSIYHESTGSTDRITLDDISESNFPSHKLYEGLKLGKHNVKIEKIVDSNGCTSDMSSDSKNFITITITDVPKIQLLDPSNNYCVGDYVAYQMTGFAPFEIKYEFNGVQLKSVERSKKFVRIASEAGSISINSIKDSNSQCFVNFTRPGLEEMFNQLSLVIHPIPSVTVSQGEHIYEDIHEGDKTEVIFSFEGTPPFALTYVRTETSEMDGSPQVVETKKVSDIWTYEYKVPTSLQGTYEAIEISDAFCAAKNDAFFQI